MELHCNLVGSIVIWHCSLDHCERPSAAFEREYMFPPSICSHWCTAFCSASLSL